jgi:hypothetical protein
MGANLLPLIRFWILHGQKEPPIVTANSILELSRAKRASHCYHKFDFGAFTGAKSPPLLPQIRFWIIHGQKEPLIVTANSILELFLRSQRASHCYHKFDFGSFTGTKSPHCYRKFDFGSFTGKKSLPLLPQIRRWILHGQKEPLIVTANSILDPSRAKRAPHCYRKFDFGSFTGYNARFRVRLRANCARNL